MYKFKIKEAEIALKALLEKHPADTLVMKALEGDESAMYDVYCRMVGDSECPSPEALHVLEEACERREAFAMVRMSQVKMRQGWKFWPEGLNRLLESDSMGVLRAGAQMDKDWNEVKGLEHSEEPLNEYQLYAIGFFYWYGKAIRKNTKRAESYMLRAAAKGCKEAITLLQKKYPESFKQKIDAEKNRAPHP